MTTAKARLGGVRTSPAGSQGARQGPSRSPTLREVPGRREKRLLLPSNRVAVMAMPNVGEFLDLRGEALRLTASSSGPGNDATRDIETGMHLGKLLLRRCLVGLTARPVETLFKAGFDVSAVRAKAEAESAELVAKGEPGLDIEAVVIAAEDAAEDVEAMKTSARPDAVTDYVWNEEQGEVGKYLATMPRAEMNTAEAADWRALHDYASFVMQSEMRTPDGPKAEQPRIRRLR